MNVSILRNMVYSIFAFMAVAYSYAYGQSSGFPRELPNPSFRASAGEGINYDSNGNVTEWQNLARGNYLTIPSGEERLQHRINSSGQHYIYQKSNAYWLSKQVTYSEPGSKYYNPDIFIVRKNRSEESSSFQMLFDGSLSGYDGLSLSINSYASDQDTCVYTYYCSKSVRPWTNTMVYNIHCGKYNNGNSNMTEDIYVNGQLINSEALRIIANEPSFDKSFLMILEDGELYEVLVFENLTDTQRRQIANYLMNKYDVSPDIPKTGLTLWVRADKGVTTDTTGSVTNIKDHSPTNATYRGGYGYVSGDGSMLFWDSHKSVPQQQAVGYYSCRGFDRSFVNGKEAEFFAVIHSQDNQYYDREILNFSGQRTLFSWSNPTQIKESFGRRPSDIVSMNDGSLSLNNKSRLYNINVGGGYWEAHINNTLLKKENYTLTTNLSINSFYFGRSSGDLGNPSKGGLSEILLYNRKLSDSERTQVKNYLMTKYELD